MNNQLTDKNEALGAYLDASQELDAATDNLYRSPSAAAGEVPPTWRLTLEWLIREVDRNTCTHEETHRAGAIWTVCTQCGKKWADDEGGFKPYAEPAELTRARALLAAAPQPPAAAEAVAWEVTFRRATGIDKLFVWKREDAEREVKAELITGVRPLVFGGAAQLANAQQEQELPTNKGGEGDEPLIVYVDGKPVDVTQHYASVHKMKLPPTPTMTGLELRLKSGRQDAAACNLMLEVDPLQDRAIRAAESLPLAHGMKFYTVPPASAF